jgi:hypothetical protein
VFWTNLLWRWNSIDAALKALFVQNALRTL